MRHPVCTGIDSRRNSFEIFSLANEKWFVRTFKEEALIDWYGVCGVYVLLGLGYDFVLKSIFIKNILAKPFHTEILQKLPKLINAK